MNQEEHYEAIKPPLLPKRGISDEVAEMIINPFMNKGYPTQYTQLDGLIGGLKEGGFIVLGAEQGRGKSLFALNLILEQHRNGIKSVYIDIENGEPQTWKRLLMINYQLDGVSVMELSKDQVKEMASGIDNVSYYNEKDLYSQITEGKVLKDVTIDLIKEQSKEGYKIFVLDPFSRFCEDDPRNELHEEGMFAGMLADLARELKICIVAIHHLRKGNKNKRVSNESEIEAEDYALPTLEGFRGSSKIIDRATEVIGLVRFPKPVGRDVANIRVLKSRTGQTGHFYLDFDIKTLTFEEDQYKKILDGVATEIKS